MSRISENRTDPPSLPAVPDFVSPMLLSAQREPFVKPGWMFEPKLDGMRAIASVRNGECRLYSRHGRNITEIFPTISKSLIERESLVLDGEIVVLGADGKPDFEALQSRWNLKDERKIAREDQVSPVTFFVFDILYRRGECLFRYPLSERKQILVAAMPECERIKRTATFTDGLSLFLACQKEQLEGIVAKREASTYKVGQRSKDWIKIKNTQTEAFVIVGHHEDSGFLLADSAAQIVGSVHHGFTRNDLAKLWSRLQPLTPDAKGQILFLPEVFVRVEFMAKTKTGMLRAPVFKSILGE